MGITVKELPWDRCLWLDLMALVSVFLLLESPRAYRTYNASVGLATYSFCVLESVKTRLKQ